MSFVFGALGAVAVFGLYALGVFTGWKLHKRFFKPNAPSPSEIERQRLIAEQEAFSKMQNYNAETAYGMNGGIFGEEDDAL